MGNVRDYTIGFITLSAPEGVALRLFLDAEHDAPRTAAVHKYALSGPTYVAGTMGVHRVVIATLPEGSYGISPASSVLSDMMHNFPNMRCCLMVGTGGGAPLLPDHDIRLGDVVVSTPQYGLGGVLQYDHGKAVQNRPFLSTQHLNKPPGFLMSAVGELTQRYEMDDMPLQGMVKDALDRNPRLRRTYQRPDASTDRLYRTNYVHTSSNRSRQCSELCGDDTLALVQRPQREEGPDDLIVHRGIIASGSGVIRDATIRDRWAKEKGVLCFETETAGLINSFPCLAIRGISNYADTHKNDDWRGFAAMMAAAYAKEILSVLQSWAVDAVDGIGGLDIQAISNGVSNVERSIENATRTYIEADEGKRKALANHDTLHWSITRTKLSTKDGKAVERG